MNSRRPARQAFLTTCMIVLCVSVATPAAAQQTAEAKAKYIFLLIGDGMGTAHRAAAEAFLSGNVAPGQRAKPRKLTMNSMPIVGLTTTHSNNSTITDSAASGTALATGHKTNNGTVSMDPEKKKAYKTIAEIAKSRGMKVGIITSESICGATPAVFYAHQPERGEYYEISMQLGRTQMDFFGGGASAFANPKARGDRPCPAEQAKHNGFTVVTTAEQMRALKPDAGKTWVALRDANGSDILDYEIDMPKGAITLAELTAKAIKMVDNPKGFFIMVEGAKIDWSAHSNDSATIVRETLAFDRAVAEAMKFYKRHPAETLIVVTADHETGGMTFTGDSSKIAAVIAGQKMSSGRFAGKVAELSKNKAPFAKALNVIEEAFGLDELSPDELKRLKEAHAVSMSDAERTKADRKLYGHYDPLTITCTRLVAQRASIDFSTFGHTGAAVPTSAIGVGSKLFDGKYDNTDICKRMLSVMVGAREPAAVR